jgi:hypothetical protein
MKIYIKYCPANQIKKHYLQKGKMKTFIHLANERQELTAGSGFLRRGLIKIDSSPVAPSDPWGGELLLSARQLFSYLVKSLLDIVTGSSRSLDKQEIRFFSIALTLLL